MNVERLLEHDRLGDLAVPMSRDREAPQHLVRRAHQRVHPHRRLRGVVDVPQERPRLLGAELVEPFLGQPLRDRVPQSRARG